MTSQRIRVLVVVVPVHDEEELLDRSLASLGAAVDAVRARGVRCVVRIVLDACRDKSAEIAARHGFPALTIDAGAVGAARAWGIASALTEVGDVPARKVWIANTDADSSVPVDWLTTQCRLAARGADVFVGTVRPDFADLAPAHVEHWRATHVRGIPNGHVHGASLGVRASVYDAVGGFEAVVEHEDVELVARCRAVGARIQTSDAAEVITSGRLVGRTPGGYAGHLREQARLLDGLAVE